MKKRILLWQLGSFLFIVGLGIILHFLYDWTNKSIFFAPYSAVNESIWEHMKILFFPMFFIAIIESFFLKEINNFWTIKLKGILIGVLFIPICYYVYSGIIGTSYDWLNILIFIVAAFISTFYEYRELIRKTEIEDNNSQALFLIAIFAIFFIIFTFNPPSLNIFKDPVSGLYGIHLLLF